MSDEALRELLDLKRWVEHNHFGENKDRYIDYDSFITKINIMIRKREAQEISEEQFNPEESTQ